MPNKRAKPDKLKLIFENDFIMTFTHKDWLIVINKTQYKNSEKYNGNIGIGFHNGREFPVEMGSYIEELLKDYINGK